MLDHQGAPVLGPGEVGERRRWLQPGGRQALLVVVDAHVAEVDRGHPVRGVDLEVLGNIGQPGGLVGGKQVLVESPRQKVVSTPKSTSPSGASLVRIAWLSVGPGIPCGQHLHCYPGLVR